MVFKNVVKNIQAAAYNGAHTVGALMIKLIVNTNESEKKLKYTVYYIQGQFLQLWNTLIRSSIELFQMTIHYMVFFI